MNLDSLRSVWNTLPPSIRSALNTEYFIPQPKTYPDQLSDAWQAAKDWWNPPKTYADHLSDAWQTTKDTFKQIQETAPSKINGAASKAGLFINENSNEVAAGAAAVGGFALIKGAVDLGEGHKKRGIAEIAVGTLGLGSAGYIQSETLVKPLAQTMQPYVEMGTDWVKRNIHAFPESTSIIGAAGGGVLALGINDLAKGNRKRGLIETITGLAGLALGIWGLQATRNGTCPDLPPDTCPAL